VERRCNRRSELQELRSVFKTMHEMFLNVEKPDRMSGFADRAGDARNPWLYSMKAMRGAHALRNDE